MNIETILAVGFATTAAIFTVAVPAGAQTAANSAAQPAQAPPMTYHLAGGSETWPADKRERVVKAMDEAVALYNALGTFPKQVTASYNTGTPTADGNFNGNIRFGGQIGTRVALHELGHVLGAGTAPRWGEFARDGLWTGPNAIAQLREFDGPDAVLHADRQHFWPYGLNFDGEDSAENRRRHVLMVAALRADMGLNGGAPFVPVKSASMPLAAPPTLAGREFLTLPGAGWKLSFSDEFNGDTLDKSKWSIGLPWGGTDGTGRHHNDQYASYTMDDDVRVSGGLLHLTTQKRDITDKKGNLFRYSQGLITTNKSFRSSYGYFETRAKMPTEAGPGTWPAFWTLLDGWPPEFDIIEYWGSDNRTHQGTVTAKADGGQRWDSQHRSNVSISGWHTFGLEWGPGYQHYNIDGKITYSIYGEHLTTERGHYLLLNSGVDARRPPTSATIFPNDFQVDYARVYARPDVPALQNGDFENQNIAPWTRTGEAAVVDYDAHNSTRCGRVDGGDKPGEMRQTIYGLKPNTRYMASAQIKGNGSLKVADFGGAAGAQVTARPFDYLDAAAATYALHQLSFTTGDKATSATLICEGPKAGVAFFDDVKLQAQP